MSNLAENVVNGRILRHGDIAGGMSSLTENVAKVTAAHAALKEAIAAKGVAVPDGTKLSAMPALVEQISTEPVPTNPRAVFTSTESTSLVIPKTLVVDMVSMTNFRYLLYNSASLRSVVLSDGFGQNATDLYFCFASCSHLKTLHLPDGFGQNATNLNSCFASCQSLTTLHLPDGFGQDSTSNINCFSDCSSLTTLHLPDGFGQNSTRNNNCFLSCKALTTITGNPNFKVSFSLSDSTQLTHDSLMVIINGLQTVTGQTITLGTTNLAKLTDEEKKVATDKGWTIA